MGVFENFPYSNFHDLNLDWILTEIQNLTGQLSETQADLLQTNLNISELSDSIPGTVRNVLDEDNIHPLPAYSAADNGKVFGISSGQAQWIDLPDGNLPLVTADEDGVMLVGQGEEWTKIDVLSERPSTINLYDSSLEVPRANPEYVDTEVYFRGHSGKMVLSTAGGRSNYFQSVRVFDINGNDLGVTLGGTSINRIYGPLRQGRALNIPSNAYKMTFTFRASVGGVPYVHDVMLTEGETIVDGNFVPYIPIGNILLAAREFTEQPVYVSPSGSDSNDGLSMNAPLATFSKALAMSDTVIAERGRYAEAIILNGRQNVAIYPYDGDVTYAAGTARPKIEIGSVTRFNREDMIQIDPGVFTVYVGNVGLYYHEVFETHSLQPVVNLAQKIYRANVFVDNVDGEKIKLKPVLNVSDVGTGPYTFSWVESTGMLTINVGTSIYMESIAIPGTASDSVYGVIENCDNVTLQEVVFGYAYGTNLQINKSENVRLIDCEAYRAATSMGFQANSSNVEFIRCTAYENGYDGFNFHEYGFSTLTDCTAANNYDDGVSHHEACIGQIRGGLFEKNGKGGITPAYGANVNIYGALCRNNDSYGIGFLSQASDPDMYGIIANCTLIGNNLAGLRVGAKWTVDGFNICYDSNTADKIIEGTYNEYGGNGLPIVTSADYNKTLKVDSNGTWAVEPFSSTYELNAAENHDLESVLQSFIAALIQNNGAHTVYHTNSILFGSILQAAGNAYTKTPGNFGITFDIANVPTKLELASYSPTTGAANFITPFSQDITGVGRIYCTISVALTYGYTAIFGSGTLVV